MSSKTKLEGYVIGRSTSGDSSVMQYPRTPSSRNGIPAAEQYTCEVNSPSMDEVCAAIRQLRSDRARGEDGIPADIYKTCLGSLSPWLHHVISKVWSNETAPGNCNEVVLLSPLMKGDKHICSNIRAFV